MVGGGGASDLFPAPLAAGERVLYSMTTPANKSNTAYANVGAGWGFQVKKAGTYRVRYAITTGIGMYPYSSNMQLTKNGAAISGSALSNPVAYAAAVKTMDLPLVVGDVIRAQAYVLGGEYAAVVFAVSATATELGEQIDGTITVV